MKRPGGTFLVVLFLSIFPWLTLSQAFSGGDDFDSHSVAS